MKKIALILLTLAFSSIAIAQTGEFSTIIGTETESITDIGKNKNNLWSNAQAWANSVSTEYQKKIVSEDKDNGTMILTVETYLPGGTAGMNEYSKVKAIMNLKIDCREKKYRTIFSNFASAIGVDRTVETKLLSSTQLNSMIKELQRVEDLSVRDFKKETIWGIENILSAKSSCFLRIKEHQSVIDSQDKESKSGKKEVNKRTAWIAANNETIAFLDFILLGIGKKVNEINENINKSMMISDNF